MGACDVSRALEKHPGLTRVSGCINSLMALRWSQGTRLKRQSSHLMVIRNMFLVPAKSDSEPNVSMHLHHRGLEQITWLCGGACRISRQMPPVFSTQVCSALLAAL